MPVRKNNANSGRRGPRQKGEVDLGSRSDVAEVSFERLQRHTVTADAIRLIKTMIGDGRLKPGQRLPSERALGEALGVSRTAIRESIRSLVAMNILESRQGSGTFVSSLDLEELLHPMQFVLGLSQAGLKQLFEVRLVLEPKAAALAAERGTDEQITAVRDCAARAEQSGHDHDRLLELDIELHRLVVEASDNDLLINIMASISALGVESRAHTVQIPGVAEQTLKDHTRIAEAMAARDPHAAREAMSTHIVNVRDAVAADGVAPARPDGRKAQHSQAER
jgi:GntR family transcriptional repressor for pyruvate dehydrogenase complex